MNGQNTQLASTLLLDLLTQVGPALATYSQAKAEGRDITDAELGSMFDAEKIAAAKLDAAIAG